MGNLTELRINVIKAYTGVAATLTMNITALAFNSSLVESDLSQIVNLKTAGLRVVTPAAVTGSVAGDTLTATGVWISGAVNVVIPQVFADSLEKLAIVEVEWKTDQGLIGSKVVQFGGLTQAHATPITDTTSLSN